MKLFLKSFTFIPLLFLSFMTSQPVFSQEFEEEECGMSEDKKAVKAYENAMNSKKYSYKERVVYFREAIDIDPDFTLAIWNRTFLRIKDARSKHKPYQNTENDLRTVVQNCPDIHSAPYFFLGEINMNKGEFQEAADYYDMFIHFSSDDDSKFERRYEEQLATAKANLEVAKFLAYQYANPQPFNPKKVVPLSTEENDEYLPCISPDNEVMLYTRKIEVHQNERETYVISDKIAIIERFSVSNVTEDGFDKGQAFGVPFNMNPKANYGGSAISTTNKEIFFTVCEPIMGKMNCDIYYSKYEFSAVDAGGEEVWHWTKPESVGPNINTDDGWEAQPTISKDGKWMMYAVFRKGTRGIDLFQSKRLPNGNWGIGESMGEPINTAGDEKSPFFHSDDKTLYFSSRGGHLGMGGYDIFMSRFVNGAWTKPANIGYPLNTVNDEHGYVVSLDGRTAYFGSASPFSNKKGKSIDIYAVKIPPQIRPDKVLMVKGTVKNKSGGVPKDAQIEIRNTKTQEVELVDVDTADGRYTAIVNVEDTADYMLTAKGEDVAFNNKLIKAPKEEEPIKKNLNIEIQKSKVGQHITIENIHFGINSADLSSDSKASLDALIAYMKTNPEYRVSIEGHTDNKGDMKANLALSADRAYSVLAYLQENGVSSKRLRFKGWGASKPLTTNKTVEGRALNRRIEIVVLDM